MSKKLRTRKRARRPDRNRSTRKNARYSAGEIAMAVLGGAILIMVVGIIITSIL